MLVTDGLANLVSSLGTDKDKARATQWFVNSRTPDQFEALFRASAFARKIVTIPTSDMIRRWRFWSTDDAAVTKIEAAEKRFRIRHVLSRAHMWGRLYGASAIIVGANQRLGSPDTPLDIGRMGAGDLSYLHVDIYPRLQISEYETDIESPLFGQPRIYLYNPVVRGGTQGQQVRIHASRVIPFAGMPLPAMSSINTLAWGDSVFTALEDTLNTAGTTTAIIATMLHEAKLDVIKTDLAGVGNDDGEARILRRFQLANVLKSTNNMLLLGKEEDFETKTLNFAGLPDIHVRMLQELSGAADIPATRLLGQAPAGLQATGESDLRNYYDSLSAKQEDELTEPVNRLDALLCANDGIVLPKGSHWSWHSLWQETETQKAENGLKRAQATKIYAESGLIPSAVMSKATVSQLVESGTYPALDSAMKEYEAERDELEAVAEGDDDEGKGGDTNVIPFRQAAQDAAPRSLYVSRKLLNAKDVLDWARSQGLKNLVAPAEMHATVAYSRAPVDWMAVAQAWNSDKVKVPAGGPRLVEPIGGKGAVALLFTSWDFSSRHREILEAGASWDHPDYTPHVTLTWDLGDADLSKVVPYNGPLTFGPEVFEEINESEQAGVAAE